MKRILIFSLLSALIAGFGSWFLTARYWSSELHSHWLSSDGHILLENIRALTLFPEEDLKESVVHRICVAHARLQAINSDEFDWELNNASELTRIKTKKWASHYLEMADGFDFEEECKSL